jgi:hypothetical protein
MLDVRCDHPCAQQTKAAWVDSPEVGSNQIASKMGNPPIFNGRLK